MVGSAIVSAGAEFTGKAASALEKAQAAATFHGKDGSTGAAGARALLDGLSFLSGSPDAKKVLSASWVVVSESARFFTIGKVAVAVLEQIYTLWNAWDRKAGWVGLFVAYCKLVEEDLLAAMDTFKHVGALRALEQQLEQARNVLDTIVSRNKYASFVFAQYDEQALQEQQVQIEARKRECLFGHAAEVKAASQANLKSVQLLAELVRQRQERLEREAAFPGGLEERGRKMKHLAREFGAMDMTARIEELLALFARAQRKHWLRAAQARGDEQAIERYVAVHFAPHGLVHSASLDAQQAGSDEADPSDAEATAREIEAFGRLDPAGQASQLEQLRASLTTAQKDATEALGREEFANCLARIKQGRAVLFSLRVLAPDAAYADSSSAFSALVSRVRDAQLSRGALLPASPSFEALLSFSGPPSPSERAVYLSCFARAFAAELALATAWLALDAQNAVWKEKRVLSKERILVIRAPPPREAAAASSSGSAGGADESTLTASIFLAVLSEIAPRSLRAMHFVPDPAARAAAEAQRAARKAAREKERSAARFAEALVYRNAWSERNAARARAREEGDYADEDEPPPPAEIDDAERAKMLAASQVTETPEETEQAEASLAAAAAASTASGIPTAIDVVSASDLRRAFPSLVFQLAQCMPVFYANLLTQSAQLTRANFAQINVADMLSELLVAQIMLPGKQQSNPNEHDASAPGGALVPRDGAQAVPERVCMALDGAQWPVPSALAAAAADAAGEPLLTPDGWEQSLLKALLKQVGPRFPPWLGVLLTVPHKSASFDKRVLRDPSAGAREMLLTKHAIDDDLSAFVEPFPPLDETVAAAAAAEGGASTARSVAL